ncbi:hypothetical protein TRFO_15001 [Tritrichomonas foetus]|uniref:Uncharacterized protein n=1 Tax=Tritrichomonas foetus TaxID=1144522 RepID=A0A1J4KUM5_9EUKA|nr:hypothetical protein TRFO_15001 [Tritrichomonas foetus]|eukprot:OHT14592.1 hypothetical protein TRFO_15001 [Tritrichomonas foetus]
MILVFCFITFIKSTTICFSSDEAVCPDGSIYSSSSIDLTLFFDIIEMYIFADYSVINCSLVNSELISIFGTGENKIFLISNPTTQFVFHNIHIELENENDVHMFSSLSLYDSIIKQHKNDSNSLYIHCNNFFANKRIFSKTFNILAKNVTILSNDMCKACLHFLSDIFYNFHPSSNQNNTLTSENYYMDHHSDGAVLLGINKFIYDENIVDNTITLSQMASTLELTINEPTTFFLVSDTTKVRKLTIINTNITLNTNIERNVFGPSEEFYISGNVTFHISQDNIKMNVAKITLIDENETNGCFVVDGEGMTSIMNDGDHIELLKIPITLNKMNCYWKFMQYLEYPILIYRFDSETPYRKPIIIHQKLEFHDNYPLTIQVIIENTEINLSDIINHPFPIMVAPELNISNFHFISENADIRSEIINNTLMITLLRHIINDNITFYILNDTFSINPLCYLDNSCIGIHELKTTIQNQERDEIYIVIVQDPPYSFVFDLNDMEAPLSVFFSPGDASTAVINLLFNSKTSQSINKLTLYNTWITPIGVETNNIINFNIKNLTLILGNFTNINSIDLSSVEFLNVDLITALSFSQINKLNAKNIIFSTHESTLTSIVYISYGWIFNTTHYLAPMIPIMVLLSDTQYFVDTEYEQIVIFNYANSSNPSEIIPLRFVQKLEFPEEIPSDFSKLKTQTVVIYNDWSAYSGPSVLSISGQIILFATISLNIPIDCYSFLGIGFLTLIELPYKPNITFGNINISQKHIIVYNSSSINTVLFNNMTIHDKTEGYILVCDIKTILTYPFIFPVDNPALVKHVYSYTSSYTYFEQIMVTDSIVMKNSIIEQKGDASFENIKITFEMDFLTHLKELGPTSEYNINFNNVVNIDMIHGDLKKPLDKFPDANVETFFQLYMNVGQSCEKLQKNINYYPTYFNYTDTESIRLSVDCLDRYFVFRRQIVNTFIHHSSVSSTDILIILIVLGTVLLIIIVCFGILIWLKGNLLDKPIVEPIEVEEYQIIDLHQKNKDKYGKIRTGVRTKPFFSEFNKYDFEQMKNENLKLQKAQRK